MKLPWQQEPPKDERPATWDQQWSGDSLEHETPTQEEVQMSRGRVVDMKPLGNGMFRFWIEIEE
jgi:hypothetical protein